MKRPLTVLSIAIASLGEVYREKSHLLKIASGVLKSGKYFANPELRAEQQLPSVVSPVVQVNTVFHLHPNTLKVPSADGVGVVTIHPPFACTGPGSVQVRLISHRIRQGQEIHVKGIFKFARVLSAVAPKSPCLLVHCHGGGFVAQSSRSHQDYLRQWAKHLDIPILSVDYSLAPEFPFPRALEECFYAYAWALNNCAQLGSTGERVVLAGDSAGGNLVTSTAFRASSFNIRCPDAVLAIYPSLLVSYTSSPSRLLSLMDPLLPAGILCRCLAAYAGVVEDDSGASDDDDGGGGYKKLCGKGKPQLLSSICNDADWVMVDKVMGDGVYGKEVLKEHSPPPSQVPTYVCDHSTTLAGSVGCAISCNVAGNRMDTSTDLLSDTCYGATKETRGVDVGRDVAAIHTVGVDVGRDVAAIHTVGVDVGRDVAAIHTVGVDVGRDVAAVHTVGVDVGRDVAAIHTVGVNVGRDVAAIHTVGVDVGRDVAAIHTVGVDVGRDVAAIHTVGVDVSRDVAAIHTVGVDVGRDVAAIHTVGVDVGRDVAAIHTVGVDVGRDVAALHTVGVDVVRDAAALHTVITACLANTSLDSGEASQNPGPIIGRSKTSITCDPSVLTDVGSQYAHVKVTLGRSLSQQSNVDHGTVHTSRYASPSDFTFEQGQPSGLLKSVRNVEVVKNPYMSPLLAPDSMLRDLPPITLVACHLDPLLDDSVMFARRLRGLGKSVDITFIDDLPHGFLNFAVVSAEARVACRLCADKLKVLFNLNTGVRPSHTSVTAD